MNGFKSTLSVWACGENKDSCGTHSVDPYQVFSQDDENHFAKADNLPKVLSYFSELLDQF